MRCRRLTVPLVGVLSGLVLLAASAETALGAQEPRTPIKHFVSLMQQNHSFDNYFGYLPQGERHPRERLYADQPRAAAGEMHQALSSRRQSGS